MKNIIKLTLCFFILSAFSAEAFVIEKKLDDPQSEKRAKELFAVIKCMVCDGQSIETSDVEHARAMRKLIRDMVSQKKTNQEITEYIKNIYGESSIFVSSINKNTFILFLLPSFFLLIGFSFIYYYLRKNNANS